MTPPRVRGLLSGLIALCVIGAVSSCSAADHSGPPPARGSAGGSPPAQQADNARRVAAATTDPRVIASRIDVPVLCFHQIRDWRPSDSRSDRGIITPPGVFARQMDVLGRSGFTPI